MTTTTAAAAISRQEYTIETPPIGTTCVILRCTCGSHRSARIYDHVLRGLKMFSTLEEVLANLRILYIDQFPFEQFVFPNDPGYTADLRLAVPPEYYCCRPHILEPCTLVKNCNQLPLQGMRDEQEERHPVDLFSANDYSSFIQEGVLESNTTTKNNTTTNDTFGPICRVYETRSNKP